jgi:hypothetical protein
MSNMPGWQVFSIIGIVAVVIAALVFFMVSGTRKTGAEVKMLDGTLVNDYVQAIAAENYRKAYDECLSAEYRGNMALADFEEKQRARRAEFGAVHGRKLTWQNSTSNIFSRVREHQFQYDLSYPGTVWAGWIVLTNADGAWRVNGTYVKTGGKGLNFKVW